MGKARRWGCVSLWSLLGPELAFGAFQEDLGEEAWGMEKVAFLFVF